MPRIDNIEETPNPNAVKFILKEPVTGGAPRNFRSVEQAASDQLVRSIFEVGDVVSVFYIDRMITVEKEDSVDWDELLPRLAVPIRAAESVKPTDAATTQTVNQVESSDPRLIQINQILDQRIRPALQGDGGWLDVVGLEGNTLSIRYQGACGSCPSSITGTLMAIENMLRSEVDPELDVVTV
jgi:NFU1 iron-sulfur cluster scaffold homolog, mitochondrial